MFVDDDLGWMFSNAILPWEKLGLKSTDKCVVDLVDFWLEECNEHIRINYFRRLLGKRPLQEEHMPLLIRHVAEVRWRKRGRPY